MPLGDGIRRNVAKIDPQERTLFKDAILELNRRYYPGGVSKWKQQDAIHQATHVHGGASFLPWHRELCNQFEAALREVDPRLSLHYWDWTTDPRNSPDANNVGVNLFTPQFMGSDTNQAGPPLDVLFPPIITRNVTAGLPARVDTDNVLINWGNNVGQQDQYDEFSRRLEGTGINRNHNYAHPYIGGTLATGHSAFEDPFVFLLHSNVDRLWAMWQVAAGQAWRLDPNQVYGRLRTDPDIVQNLEPWAGGTGTLPWTNQFPWEIEVKNSLAASVVNPATYDTFPASILPPTRILVNVVSLQSFNYRTFFIRHRNYLGEISPVSSLLDRRDGTFRMVEGLSNAAQGFVSFESVNYPRYFLRHENFELKLHHYADNQLFRDDATFRMVPGLANPSWFSFESHNFPGHYIRHQNYRLHIGDVANADIYFREDATFQTIGSLIP